MVDEAYDDVDPILSLDQNETQDPEIASQEKLLE